MLRHDCSPLYFTNDEGTGRGRHDLVVLPEFGAAVTHFPAPQHDATESLDGTENRRPGQLQVQIDGRRELSGGERCRKRGAHGIVEHGREESTLHVSCRIEESVPRIKAGFNGAALTVDFDEAEPERL